MIENRTSQQLMSHVYDIYWRNEKTHGPADARTSLLRRARPALKELAATEWALDLGAGRQVVEKQMLSNKNHGIKANIATIDIASLTRKQLLRRNAGNVHHARGDGTNLPYPDASFSVVISSMGLELMPFDAISELARVMRPDGKAFLNVLDPSVSSSKRDLVAMPKRNRRTTESDRRAQDFWDHYARPDNVFNKGEAAIRLALAEHGLNTERIETIEGRGSAWIEIEATRSRIPFIHQTLETFVRGMETIDTLTAGQPLYLCQIEKVMEKIDTNRPKMTDVA